jgi:hypothetical protein
MLLYMLTLGCLCKVDVTKEVSSVSITDLTQFTMYQ